MNKKSDENWLVPEGFASHWIQEMDSLLSPERETENQSFPIEAIHLFYQIFSKISESESGAGVTDIATALNTSKSRISRQLQAMSQLGMVERDEATRKYRIGKAMINWGLRGLGFHGVNENVYRALSDLQEACGGKTVIFAILDKNWGRVVLSLGATRGEPLNIPVGTALIFPRSPSARVLWAFDEGKEDLLKSARASEFIHHTSFGSVAELVQSLENTRRAMVTATFDVRMDNRGSVAAPVFDSGDKLLGTIAVADFSKPLKSSGIEKLATQVKTAARKLSAELGSTRWDNHS